MKQSFRTCRGRRLPQLSFISGAPKSNFSKVFGSASVFRRSFSTQKTLRLFCFRSSSG